jgi:hypothetical protein
MSARFAARALMGLVVAGVLDLGAVAGALGRSTSVGLAKAGGNAAKATPVHVALYGDSLASEAQEFFVSAVTAHRRAEIRTGTYGGTAICDWLDQMRTDAANGDPERWSWSSPATR